MIEWRAELDEAIQRIISYTEHNERVPKEYMPGVCLLPREMYTIEMIAQHPGANTTELSRLNGLQKSMVSKMTRDLEKRGIIARYQEKDNLKEIHYRLAPLGQQLYDAHMRFHRECNYGFYEYFENLTVDKKAFLVDALCRYAEHMKVYSEKYTCWFSEEQENKAKPSQK